MNSARSSHEISGLPHCLVDGFKHRMPDIPYEDRCYILTHYHSDHYGGLASYWKHGKIYCSHTTANLICNVLQVSEKTVCRVAIGETIRIKGAAVTFMEANHCPGAVILLFALDTGMNHLHTGDLRYCPAMKLYPALQGVKIDKVYLDTTYAHPKHTFMTQEESISKIVNLAKEFLSSHPDDGIIYMSAYNLGKERVVFALSDALDVPVYMDADKIHIMNQIPGGAERVQAGKFTNNPRVGRIHICQMGFLGTLFPYFKPNFDGIRQHMEELNRYQVEADGIRHYLDTPHCPMPLILHAEPSTAGSDGQPGTAALSTVKPIPMRAAIAFIPTGWADDGNYNKTHNVMTDGEVTVCTVPYSEHSNCAELVEFVRFLRPREVVPTVYSDEKNRLAILELFRNCVNRTENMRNFIAKFGSPAPVSAAPAAASSSSAGSGGWRVVGSPGGGEEETPAASVQNEGDRSTSKGDMKSEQKEPVQGALAVRPGGLDGSGRVRPRQQGERGGSAEKPAVASSMPVDLCSSSEDEVEQGVAKRGRRGEVAAAVTVVEEQKWSCSVCTYCHTAPGSERFLQCELCGSPRR